MDLCFVSKQKDMKSPSDSGKVDRIWISGEFHDPQAERQAAQPFFVWDPPPRPCHAHSVVHTLHHYGVKGSCKKK